MELRTFTVLDSLQPQLTGFLQTVCQGFMPLEEQAALFIEIAPGHRDQPAHRRRAQGDRRASPGMQIVERAYGMLELHDDDQGQVRAAGAAILERMGATRERPAQAARSSRRRSSPASTATSRQLINRMRHGDMIVAGQTLYILEVHPAAYAALAANEAEKAAPIHLLEFVTFGAFGRLWLGGGEAEIREAARAAEAALAALDGRDDQELYTDRQRDRATEGMTSG